MITYAFGLDVLGKATLLLMAVVSIDMWLRRWSSAALRHRCWGIAFIALLVLPLFSVTIPAWRLAVLPANWQAESSGADSAVTEPFDTGMSQFEGETGVGFGVPEATLASPLDYRLQRGGAESMHEMPAALAYGEQAIVINSIDESEFSYSWGGLVPDFTAASIGIWCMVIWCTGAVVAILPLLFGVLRNHWTKINAREIEAAEPTRVFEGLRQKLEISREVSLLETSNSIVPMTWGVLRPVVVLPSEWREWNPENRRLVLLHELAHVKRLDVLFQTIARVVCALFWFQPLVWYALRRLRIERELACDDCVLMAGEKPSHYARQLLTIARQFHAQASPPAVAMAQRSGLEARVRALLDKARSHLPISRRVARLLFGGALIAVALLAAVKIEAVAGASDEASESRDDKPASVFTVSGKVLDEAGQPVSGAKVLAVRKFTASTSWLRSFEELAEVTTDAGGEYELTIPKTSTRYSDGRNFEKQTTLLIAKKPGMGPDQVLVHPGKREAQFTLAETKETIRGRIVDLEGAPVAGVKVHVHSIAKPMTSLNEWLALAAKNPATYSPEMQMMAGGSKVAFYPASYPEMEAKQAMGFKDVMTDDEGRFELKGIGDGRKVTLRIDGDAISSTYLDVVTAEFDSVPQPIDNPMHRSGKVFGKNFTYAASPAQVIQGKVTDRVTGQPVGGVTVSLHQFADHLLGIEGFIATKTDASGKYVLTGVPKAARDSRGINVEVLPSPEQPYFRSQHRVPKQAGLAAIEMDIEITSGIWIEGQIQDSDGTPVKASVAYYPELSNPNADGHEAFQKGLFAMGYGDGYFTDADGRYRIPGLPGKGAVRVVAKDAVEFKLEGPSIRNNSQPESWRLYHVREAGNGLAWLDIPNDAKKHTVDVKLHRLPSATIQVVGAEGSPLYVAGQYPTGGATLTGAGVRYWNELPVDEEFKVVLGDASQQKRPLVIYSPELEQGCVLESVADLKSDGINEFKLKPCSKIVGKLVNHGGQRLVVGHGAIDEITYNSLGKNGKTFTSPPRKHLEFQFGINPKFNEDGTFELYVPSTSRLSMFLAGGELEPLLFNDVSVSPGEIIDLCDVNVDKLLEAEKKRLASQPGEKRIGLRTSRLAPAQANGTSTTVTFKRRNPDVKKASPRANSNGQDLLHFKGVVEDPSGKPVAGAKLQFVYYQNGQLPNANMKPLAITGKDGKFDFTVRKADYVNAEGEVWRYMQLFAAKNGFGIAGKQAAIFEVSGAANQLKDVSSLLTSAAKLVSKKKIQLVPDDRPIQGRVVSVEGQPVANAKVLVKEIWMPKSKTLASWEEAAAKPKADYFSIRTTIGGINNGFQLPSIVPVVETDTEGLFTLKGIGRDRVVELYVIGSSIEMTLVKTRTNEGELVEVPFQYGTNNMRMSGGIPDVVYHPRKFTLVAAPSKPLHGKVVDAKTGKPVVGGLIAAGRQTTFSGGRSAFIQTSTDASGEFLLHGLPYSQRSVFFVPPAKSRYLPGGWPINLKSPGDTIEVEVNARAMPLIKGRVIDQMTGQPVLGAVQYFTFSNNAALKAQPSFASSEVHEVRTEQDGTFSISALPGRGMLAFLALNHGKYSRAAKPLRIGTTLSSPGDQPGSYSTVPSWLMATNFNHVQEVNVTAGEDLEVEIELAGGKELRCEVVDKNGDKVDDFVYLVGDSGAGWRKAREGAVVVRGYYEDKPKAVLVYHRDTNTAARVVLSGKLGRDGKLLDDSPIQLEPAGTIVGRVIGKNGLPLANAKMYGANLVANHFGDPDYGLFTNEHGDFEIRGLVPGLAYSLHITDDDGFSRTIFDERTFEKAKVVDLGEVKLTD